ncbi:putative homeodomain transcription factor 2 [Apostichopus japonicus]|uniref:Putative homeodomain transcription factor 2 n=1 Tax=Stichopus japonicus TaxID=307972 RepID=A0A2G8JDL4_STIJA|nr:putative homeodomain transcription factor 2 [Apostichopus japonicus]
MVPNEAISKFQQQIGAYDKERWEEHLDEKEQQGIDSQKHAPLKVGRVKTELIDVDLVRGSTFTKAKPEHAWLATTRKGLCRVLLLPLFYKWWQTQLTAWILRLMLLLYFLQFLCFLIYVFSSPAVKKVRRQTPLTYFYYERFLLLICIAPLSDRGTLSSRRNDSGRIHLHFGSINQRQAEIDEEIFQKRVSQSFYSQIFYQLEVSGSYVATARSRFEFDKKQADFSSPKSLLVVLRIPNKCGGKARFYAEVSRFSQLQVTYLRPNVWVPL